MKDAVLDYIRGVKQADSPADVLKQVYHIPVLVALIAFMLAVRLRALENFQTDGGVTFRGNDPWYHFRQTNYLLEHFPTTMPFDPMTNYPTGTSVDQFGTLYDQLVSGFILLTSFGDPSTEYAGLIMLVAAPVFLTATVVPAYLIAARFTGRWPALVGTAVFALLPGTVLRYSLVGYYDHSAAEVFFQTLGVFGFVTAIAVAQQSQPVWELVVDRDLDALRRPLVYSVGAGVAAALYMWAWPPGVLLVGFTGIFFALKITTDVYHDRSPEPMAFVGTVSMMVTGLLMLVPLKSFTIGSATQHSLLQVILPLGVGLGSLFLAYLARQWETRELDRTWYPISVGILIIVSATAFSTFVVDLTGALIARIGFSAGAGSRTIGEATPPLADNPPFEFIYSEYRLALFTAIAAALVILARPLIQSNDTRDTGYVAAALTTVGLIYLGSPVVDQIAGIFGTSWQVLGLLISTGLIVGATLRHRYEATELYLLVWGAFIISAAFTQVRFNYYLAVVVAVFNAIFIAQVSDLLDIRSTVGSVRESVESLEGWQVMAGVTIVFLVLAPFVFPTVAAWDTAGPNSNGPGAVEIWDGSLEWMNEETPAPGTLEDPDAEPMDPTGTYERPANGDYDYPDGAYGVQSWWDYGHWITVHGERIPNANPFQQGATEAANYLLAPNATAAQDALDEKMGEDGQTRYVMIDSQMANPNSKFSAPTVFNDNVSFNEFIDVVYKSQGQQLQPVRLRTQRYYESQMIRLYAYHGSAVNPAPVVLDTQRQTVPTRGGGQTTVRTFENGVQRFQTLEAARDYVEENPGAQLGGIGDNPTERVDALEHYRLIKASDTTSRNYLRSYRRLQQQTNASAGSLLRNNPSWVKTFEKVPGATIEGSGAPAGSEVQASVQMQIPVSDRQFVYTQYATADADGTFELTVPYSTTGYDEFGPENGYTNISVRANSEYRLQATSDGALYTGTATVDEAQVVGVDDAAVDVELSEEQPLQLGGQSIQASG
ncbi:oligosaccharyl transferase, archaeosortase A system-associated [Halonotius aquaticus]|uniref:dolichyl-phosphooligosaccharide-protein glycotransferase n=1 Tax=Halonotius aquaticus TaxID=2216978 RepID=A0A3A6PRD5_9EURY|nr:oligosaccharyl transferase, archaeosortase A system-associated [Halonotius aquaticus]RJX42020.1 oligosaccharyl transferase, archaeosortase A system-associated [Halonotius aquaticus]